MIWCHIMDHPVDHLAMHRKPGRLFQWLFEGSEVASLHLFECVGVPQGCYKLEQVFLPIHPLKTFSITSKARIDTIAHLCEIYALELESFE